MLGHSKGFEERTIEEMGTETVRDGTTVTFCSKVFHSWEVATRKAQSPWLKDGELEFMSLMQTFTDVQFR